MYYSLLRVTLSIFGISAAILLSETASPWMFFKYIQGKTVSTSPLLLHSMKNVNPWTKLISIILEWHVSIALLLCRQHTSAYVSIRQHTPAYASIRQHTPTSLYRGAALLRCLPAGVVPVAHADCLLNRVCTWMRPSDIDYKYKTLSLSCGDVWSSLRASYWRAHWDILKGHT